MRHPITNLTTQPLRRVSYLPTKNYGALLLGVAALFVICGSITLYIAAPTPELTPMHLGLLVSGWGFAWGTSFVLLRKKLPQADPLILPIIALLTGWGLLILARLAPGFLLRQIVWLIISCTAFCSTALISTLPRLLRRYRYTLLAGGLFFLAITLVFGVNPSGYGQRLWLKIFGAYFQPSEPLKILLVIYLAAYLGERRDLMKQKPAVHPLKLAVLGPMLTMVGIALVLLGWQQDLGAATLFYLTFAAMLYLAWGKARYVALALLLFVPVAIAGYLLSSRVELRISIWLNPWAPEQADRAFQILQSLFALASGGLFGQGLGKGTPTLIPAVHTDFVYAALVEEFGLVGALAMLALIGILIYRGIRLAQRATSPFESLLAGGITALLGIQTWVIVGGNVKLIPITGVTLPFLSYGGSSLLTTLITMGLLFNISAPHPLPLNLPLPPAAPALRQTAGYLGKVILLVLAVTALATGTWSVLRVEQLRTYSSNPRRILAEARIQRGRILDRNGTPLADIETDAEGYVTRTYPIPEAAAAVGYATLHYGTDGIEAACDPRLRGDTQKTPTEAVWDGLLHRAPQGQDVRLTIDADLQQSAQHLLEGQIGAAVLVDAHTGEVLALASSPIYTSTSVADNWAALRKNPDAPLLNRATQGLSQPGSILQTLILDTILTQEDTLPSISVPLSATVSISDTQLECRRPPGSNATWNETLSAGCVAPFTELAAQLTRQNLVKAFGRWELNKTPDFEITAQAVDWPSDTFEITAEVLGQGELLVTPLQMVGIAATLGNEGTRPALHILSNPFSGCENPNAQPENIITAERAAQLIALWPHYQESIGHLGNALAGPERTQTWFIGLNSLQVPRYAVAVLLEAPQEQPQAVDIGTQLLEEAMSH